MTYYRSHLVEANQIKQISLPFNGLYHSYLGELLTDELEYYTQDIADNEAAAVFDLIYSLDLKKYHQALTAGYALHLVEMLNDHHGLSIKINNADYEPMNGQNRGDALWCGVDVATLPIIPLAELQPYASASLTSYSGFSSFYDPDLQHLVGAKLEKWADVYITFIVEYLANDIGGAHDIEQAYIEELSCSGGAIELLFNSISDHQAAKLNALLYKDQ